VFKQESLEANLTYIDLYEKRTLMFQESIVFLKGIIVKERLHYRYRDSMTI
jgi:hypothetical protein